MKAVTVVTFECPETEVLALAQMLRHPLACPQLLI